MTFSFENTNSILKYDANIWKKHVVGKNVYVIYDNDIVSHEDDDNAYNSVVLILSGSNFNQYFLNQYLSKTLQNERTILIPRDDNTHRFSHNAERFNKDFTNIVPIGRGGFGKVYKAQHKTDLYNYAIKKVILKKKRLNKDNYKQMQTEFQILATLNNPAVVRYHTAWFETEVIIQNGNNHEPENEFSSSELSNKSDSLVVFGSTSNCDISDDKYNSSHEMLNMDDSECKASISNLSKFGNSYGSFSSNVSFFRSNQNSCSRKSSQDQENNGTVQRIDKVHPPIDYQVVLYIQMELCGHNLKDWLDIRNKSPGNLDNHDRKVIRSLARQLLSGIKYIHSNNVVHRDIKPANIFLREYVHGNEHELQLKIGDFGLAKSLSVTGDVSIDTRMSANVGTCLYTAPEVNSNRRQYANYNHKCDLYSTGIVLLELMLKITTVSELTYTIKDVKDGDLDGTLSHQWPIEASHIMNLISTNVEKRPSAEFILHKTISFKESTVENHIFEQIIEENKELNIRIKKLEKEIERLKLLKNK